MADLSLIGQRLGQYRIIREIGRGGMGVVYEAVHAVIGQRAAVKTLSVTLAKDQRNLNRFLSEARACSLIENAGVPKIFDFGQLGSGTPYILMEYLNGETLRARLNRQPQGRLEFQDAVRITRQIAVTMCAAHEKRILHRDLKPETITPVEKSIPLVRNPSEKPRTMIASSRGPACASLVQFLQHGRSFGHPNARACSCVLCVPRDSQR